jgi:radical SAM/Cys-rich protein
VTPRLPLASIGLPAARAFDAVLAAHALPGLRRAAVTTVQVNLGKRCNQACRHCHVDAGPTRAEAMAAATATRVIELVRATPSVRVVDLTGGAPELNPEFRRLVAAARASELAVIDRCNLTILVEPGQVDLAAFLAEHRVRVTASLPCYSADNVDEQRGGGVFERSVRGLRRLNALGYGVPGSGLELDLVYNPVGAFLPPPQAALEADYRRELDARFGIVFTRLITITNMPISRFALALERDGGLEPYMRLLVASFNPATVSGLMCRAQVSVGWDGALYDCDFNQMLEIPLAGGERPTIWDIDDFGAVAGREIATAAHCYGCTAGAGSSCSGALV